MRIIPTTTNTNTNTPGGWDGMADKYGSFQTQSADFGGDIFDDELFVGWALSLLCVCCDIVEIKPLHMLYMLLFIYLFVCPDCLSI